MPIDASTQELLDMLDLEPLEVNLFRGTGAGGESSARIFGGQVIAQALMAAYRTVKDRPCHSLHAYFIRPGDPEIPVIYEVDHARDGGSFTTRRVVAIQHGKQILNMAASFQAEEAGWDHQHTIPDVPGPEGLVGRAEILAANIDSIPEFMHKDVLRPRPMEIRDVAPRDFVTPEPTTDVNHCWFRMASVGETDMVMQHCLLAYMSDMTLLGSGLRPHGLTWFTGEVMSASLDHAIWFHGPIHMENWHLYAMDAPFTGHARSFNRGSVYSKDGKMVASVVQEGLMRPRR